MKCSHAASAVSAQFDEADLIADAGLLPVVRLAERARLPDLAATAIRINRSGNSGGANPAVKVMLLVAWMRAGAVEAREFTDTEGSSA